MRALLFALPLLVGCQTFQGLSEPTPKTAYDQAALDALVVDLADLATGPDEPLPEWVDEVATAYAVARSAAGNPIPPAPAGADLTRHRLGHLLAELAGDATGDLLDQDWARAVVRVYAAWRETQGDPIRYQPDPEDAQSPS